MLSPIGAVPSAVSYGGYTTPTGTGDGDPPSYSDPQLQIRTTANVQPPQQTLWGWIQNNPLIVPLLIYPPLFIWVMQWQQQKATHITKPNQSEHDKPRPEPQAPVQQSTPRKYIPVDFQKTPPKIIVEGFQQYLSEHPTYKNLNVVGAHSDDRGGVVYINIPADVREFLKAEGAQNPRNTPHALQGLLTMEFSNFVHQKWGYDGGELLLGRGSWIINETKRHLVFRINI